MPTFSPVLLRTSREIQVTDTEVISPKSNETTEKLCEKIDELEKRNVDLAARMRECQEEKQNMIKMQRQQVAQLVAEFDIVRKELDQVNLLLIVEDDDVIWWVHFPAEITVAERISLQVEKHRDLSASF